MYTDPAKKKVELPVDNTEDLFNEAERTEHSGDDPFIESDPETVDEASIEDEFELGGGD